MLEHLAKTEDDNLVEKTVVVVVVVVVIVVVVVVLAFIDVFAPELAMVRVLDEVGDLNEGFTFNFKSLLVLLFSDEEC